MLTIAEQGISSRKWLLTSLNSTIRINSSWLNVEAGIKIQAGVWGETLKRFHKISSSRARRNLLQAKTPNLFKIWLTMEGIWLNSWTIRLISRGRLEKGWKISKSILPRSKVLISHSLEKTHSKSSPIITTVVLLQFHIKKMLNQ